MAFFSFLFFFKSERQTDRQTDRGRQRAKSFSMKHWGYSYICYMFTSLYVDPPGTCLSVKVLVSVNG